MRIVLRFQMALVTGWILIALCACSQGLIVKYEPLQGSVFPSRKGPAQRHDASIEALLSNGYLLIGYIDTRQNIRDCWDSNQCEDIIENGPSEEQLRIAAAENGGDVVTWIDGKTDLEKLSKSYCSNHTTTTVTLNGKVSTIKVCTSTVTVNGYREFRTDRALVWRLDPLHATAEANQWAIERAMERLDQEYGADQKTEAPNASVVDRPQNALTISEDIEDSKTDAPLIEQEELYVGFLEAIRNENIEEISRWSTDQKLNAWRGKQGQNFFHVALLLNKFKAANAMMRSGFNWQCTDEKGFSSIDYIANFGDVANMATAIEHGASLAHTTGGRNLLFFAVHNQNAQMLGWLLDQGLDPNKADPDGIMPLLVASATGNLDAVRLLQRYNATMRCRDKRGRTPYFVAALSGHADMVDLLLACGYKLEEKDAADNNALLFAAANGQTAMIAHLVKLGMKIDHRNKRGEGVLDITYHLDHWDTSAYIIANYDEDLGFKASVGQWVGAAIENDHAELMRATLSRIPSDVREKNVDALLAEAIKKRKGKIIPVLVSFGADINDRHSNGYTLLMNAAVSGYANTVEILIKGGADATLVNPQGLTALMLATIHGHTEAVRRMRALGVKN
ncbi:MAG: ankyrin repeat domain-containing protein [Desulfobacterales bacterium]|nr:ankyrin repeat domain-containing protein [Desulfobacterales bacterium]